MANVLYGHKNTHKIQFRKYYSAYTLSVKMGIKKSLLVVDMPKGSYKNFKTAKKMQN